MKKKLSLLLVLVLIVATVLSGCGGNDTTELKMATGGTGGRRKSTRLNSSHTDSSRMPSSA